MSILGEIKRRRVFQVAAVYAVVAWLLIQIVDVVSAPLSLPVWLDTVVIVLLAVGFPIAVILAWAFDLTPDGIVATSTETSRPINAPSLGQRMSYAGQVFVVAAVGILVLDQYVLRTGIGGSTLAAPEDFEFTQTSAGFAPRFNIVLGEAERMSGSQRAADIAISPDGQRIAYVAQTDGTLRLFVRELDQLMPRMISGIDSIRLPAFSPDGESLVGIGLDGSVERISLRGSTAQVLTTGATLNQGLYWTSDGSILFTDSADGSLHRLSAEGGASERISPVPPATVAYAWPHVLPGGADVLLTISTAGAAHSGQIARLNVETGQIDPLIERAFNARYVASGHIVFMRDSTLWAAPYDSQSRQIVGSEVPLVPDVENASSTGAAAYSISDDGRLVYLPGIDTFGEQSQTLVWVDRDGREEPLGLRRSYRWPVVSPDGERLAVGIDDNGNQDIWIYDLVRTSLNRLTFDPATDSIPLWTPDGGRVIFSSTRADGGLWWRAADGTGRAEALPAEHSAATPLAFSPDGTKLVYSAGMPPDLYVLSMDGESETRQLTATPYAEPLAVISPDGAWVAYQSSEFGRPEIIVRPFPNVEDGMWQISSEGGSMPRWSPSGDEIYYRWGSARSGTRVWAASFDAEPRVVPGTPSILFSGFYVPGGRSAAFDVSPLDNRWLLSKPTVSIEQVPGQTLLVAVENWFAEVIRRAPPAE